MSNTEFKKILLSVYNGNAGKAREAAETVRYDNTSDLSEEWERIRQDRANFDLAKLRRMCYNK